MSDPDRPRDAPAPRAPRDLAHAGAVVLRVGAGVFVAAVAAACVTAASVLPLPQSRAEPRSVLVRPTPTDQVVACAGPLLRLSDASGQDATTASAVGSPDLVSGGTVTPSQSTVEDADLAGSSARPAVVTVSPTHDAARPPLVAAAQSQSGDGSETTGFAASSCEAPSSDVWLVGASTEVGRATLVSLVNPSAVPATVAFDILGTGGPITAPGTSGIVVPAGHQVVLPLAGFAPDQATLAVHVTSRGGRVVASLQESVVRGIDPGGVETIGSTATPSGSIAIPGVVVVDPDRVLSVAGRDGYGDVQPALRLVAAGGERVSARVSLVPEGGATTGDAFELDLEPHHVTDVPLEDLAAGTYTVRVDADGPVTGAVRVSTLGGDGRTDVAWVAAAAPLGGSALVAVAPGPSATLELAGDPRRASDVRVEETGGEARTVSVQTGGTASLPLDAGATYRVVGLDGGSAAVSYSGDGQIAAYPVRAPAIGAEPVRVYP